MDSRDVSAKSTEVMAPKQVRKYVTNQLSDATSSQARIEAYLQSQVT